MFKLVEIIIAAVASFAATNVDDIFILMIFFSQVDNLNFRHRHIIIGQYLGFFAIVIASLPGFFGGLIIEKKWIGILGLIPIFIGISHFINHQNENEVQAIPDNPPIMSTLTSLLSPKIYQVATITFANGGDNIGIYVPLFASSNLISLGVILSVFFVMIGVWCYIAYQLSRHSAIANTLASRGKYFVPFVLIALGVFILIDSGTYRLLIPSK